MFAIVYAGNRQFKVKPGSFIRTQRIWKSKPQDKVKLPVCALGKESEIFIEESDLKKTTVTATVLRHGLGKKLLVFKKKRRKGYRRTRGFREPFTELCISEIKLPSGEVLKDSKALKKEKSLKKSPVEEAKTAEKEELTKKSPVEEAKTAEKEEPTKKSPVEEAKTAEKEEPTKKSPVEEAKTAEKEEPTKKSPVEEAKTAEKEEPTKKSPVEEAKTAEKEEPTKKSPVEEAKTAEKEESQTTKSSAKKDSKNKNI